MTAIGGANRGHRPLLQELGVLQRAHQILESGPVFI